MEKNASRLLNVDRPVARVEKAIADLHGATGDAVNVYVATEKLHRLKSLLGGLRLGLADTHTAIEVLCEGIAAEHWKELETAVLDCAHSIGAADECIADILLGRAEVPRVDEWADNPLLGAQQTIVRKDATKEFAKLAPHLLASKLVWLEHAAEDASPTNRQIREVLGGLKRMEWSDSERQKIDFAGEMFESTLNEILLVGPKLAGFRVMPKGLYDLYYDQFQFGRKNQVTGRQGKYGVNWARKFKKHQAAKRLKEERAKAKAEKDARKRARTT